LEVYLGGVQLMVSLWHKNQRLSKWLFTRYLLFFEAIILKRWSSSYTFIFAFLLQLTMEFFECLWDYSVFLKAWIITFSCSWGHPWGSYDSRPQRNTSRFPLGNLFVTYFVPSRWCYWV
jgi:hypothetical protein